MPALRLYAATASNSTAKSKDGEEYNFSNTLSVSEK